MKRLILFLLLGVVAIAQPTPVQVVEATAAQVAAGVVGAPYYVSPRRLAGGGGPGVFSSVTDTGLTSGRLVLVGTGGLLQDSANFTYIDGTTTGQLIHPVGAAATPSLTFLGDTDTGFFWSSENTVGFASGGVAVGRLTSSGSDFHIRNAGAGGMAIAALGSIAIDASGTDQSITLTPSGTGAVIAHLATDVNARFITGNTATNIRLIGVNDAGSNAIPFEYQAFSHIFFNGVGARKVTIAGTTGNLLLGGLTTDGGVDKQLQISGTNKINFGATANATIGVSADATVGDLVATLPTTGGFQIQSATSKAFFNEYLSDGYMRLGFLATATTPTSSNYIVASNGSNAFFNSPNGDLTLQSIGNAVATFSSSSTQFSTSSAVSLTLSGGAASTLTGGAGNMTITAGTGNSRTMSLQTTTSAGTATNFLVANDTQGVTLGSLAGTGSRAVFADANGLLSASAAGVANVTRMAADATNATATVANLTDLSVTVATGVKYIGTIQLFGLDSTSVDGLQFDLGGGTATFTDIQFGFAAQPTGSTLGTITSTTSTTAVTLTAVSTSDVVYEIAFGFTCNVGGTFIPRFAKNSSTTGTATIRKNSGMTVSVSAN